MAENQAVKIEVEASKETTTPKPKRRKYMGNERRAANIWSGLNIRVTVIQIILMAIIGCASVYTTNLLSQQALANRIDSLEAVNAEKTKQRDAELLEIRTDLKTMVVTREFLLLTLKPIIDSQAEQKHAIEDLKITVLTRKASTDISP